MKKLILVCNAHIDPVWQWGWQEGAGVAVSTFNSAAKLCEEFDALIFNHNESILYEWIEKYEPALFDKIRELVKQKRWIIMGGWYLQPDCNMPSGESLKRQIERGNKFFIEKFGVKPEIATNFDVFGTSRGLVQILKNHGYRGYVSCRPYDEKNTEKDFLWKGFNGSEILLHKASDGYCTKLGAAKNKIKKYLEKFNDRECCVLFWGVGNHGGGPSRIDIKDIEKLQKDYAGVTEIVQSTVDSYFDYLDSVKQKLPLLETDLNYQLENCYTSQIRIKQMHQKLENTLFYAEKISCHAFINGGEYDDNALDIAEKDLLLAQFHDILPGTAIKDGESFGLQLLSHGLEQAERIIFDSFMRLAKNEGEAKTGEYPILIYNPHPYDVQTEIDCELMLADQNFDLGDIMIPEIICGEKKVPCQLEQAAALAPFDWKKRLIFNARLKAGEINRFECYFKQKKVPRAEIECCNLSFSNPRSTVIINNKTGLIDRYIVDGESYTGIDCFKINVIDYTFDSWGFRYNKYKKVIGAFELLKAGEVSAFYNTGLPLEPVRIIEDGDIRTVVEAVFKFNLSYAVVRYYISKESAEIKINIKIYNLEKDKVFKLSIPCLIEGAELIGKTAFGKNRRLKNNGDEVVAQDWVMLADEKKALSVINFGNYGNSYCMGNLNISLMQSAAYCAAPADEDVLQLSDAKAGPPVVLPQRKFTERIDLGFREFDFVVNAGESKARMDSIEYESLILHQKPFVLNYFPTGRSLGETKKFLELDNRCITVTSARKINGNMFKICLFNNTESIQKGTVRCIDTEKNVELKPDEYIELIFE